MDVITDLRPSSPTYRHWQGLELIAENRRLLSIPKGFAYAFQTLCDDTEEGHLISEFQAAVSAGASRCDGPAYAIDWPPNLLRLSLKGTQTGQVLLAHSLDVAAVSRDGGAEGLRAVDADRASFLATIINAMANRRKPVLQRRSNFLLVVTARCGNLWSSG